MARQTITFCANSLGPLLIKAGDDVTIDTPLCKLATSKTYRIHISKYLDIDPKDIFLHLQKVVGETVGKDEIIAQKKTRFGSKSYESEFDGILQEVNHREGIIAIETSTQIDDVQTAGFIGKVTKVDNQQVTLEVGNTTSFKLRQVKVGFAGGVKIVPDQKQLAQLVHDDVRSQVIITKSIAPVDAVRLDVLDEAGTVVLEDIPPDAPSNIARIKSLQDWDEIQSVTMPYCIVDADQSTIHFYET